MSFRVVFVISSDSAPPDGKLVGDILYVNAPDGYRNIVHKVKHMMGLVSAHTIHNTHTTRATHRAPTTRAAHTAGTTHTTHTTHTTQTTHTTRTYIIYMLVSNTHADE